MKPNGRSSAFDENVRSGPQNPALDHIAIDAKASVVRAQDGSQDIRLLRQLRLRDQGNAAALGLLNDDGADVADMQMAPIQSSSGKASVTDAWRRIDGLKRLRSASPEARRFRICSTEAEERR